MNQPQKPALPTAAQISVHSEVVSAGSEHIILMGNANRLMQQLPPLNQYLY
ncbi:MAG: hypothetical protein EZS28_050262, partial [Streblomastix strix]